MKTTLRIAFLSFMLFAFASLSFGQTYSPTYTTKVVFKDGTDYLTISPRDLNGSDSLYLPATIGNDGDVLRRSTGKTLVFAPSSVFVGGATEDLTADNQTVTVGNRGYVTVMQDDGAAASARTVVLANGSYTGQLVVFECSSTDPVEFDENGNVELSATHALRQYDTLTLLWNGSKWVETSYSDN